MIYKNLFFFFFWKFLLILQPFSLLPPLFKFLSLSSDAQVFFSLYMAIIIIIIFNFLMFIFVNWITEFYKILKDACNHYHVVICNLHFLHFSIEKYYWLFFLSSSFITTLSSPHNIFLLNSCSLSCLIQYSVYNMCYY